MKNKLIYFLILSIALGCSLKLKKNESYESRRAVSFGKKIVFPDSLEFFSEDKISQISQSNLLLSGPKIITIVNGNCRSCVEEINSWDEIHSTIIDNHGTDMLFFFVVNTNVSFFQKMYSIDIPFNFQIIIDEKESFIETNKLIENNIPNTFLLDKHNKIKLMGNPKDDGELLDLYLKNI